MKKQVYSNIMLIVAALIWGSAFVAQRLGVNHLGPFIFNGIRMMIGAVALVIYIFVRDALIKKRGEGEYGSNRMLVTGGIICGLVLFAASSFQQAGLTMGTTAGKSGFITALYIVLVPVLGIFFRKRVHFLVWVATLIAATGLYFLAVTEELTIGVGELLTICCSVFFAMHILVVDRFAPHVDGVKLSCIQFFTVGVLSLAAGALFEQYNPKAIIDCIGPLLYMGVMSSGIAYTLQILGQKHTQPAAASIIMSLESVFAALSGWVILGEVLSGPEKFGCVLVFVGVILAQTPERKKI